SGDGGDLGWRALSDVVPSIRTAVSDANLGSIVGPIEFENTWHIVRVEDRRERGVPSLETLRPRIADWLRLQEITRLQERLERVREQEQGLAPGDEVTAPADAEPQQPLRPAPDAASPPGQAAPPFPFPLGPGGVVGAPPAETPAQQPTAPTPRPTPSAPAAE